MSNNDKDDWGDDSATLFRSARGAHDPTPVDRAAFDRVFARIEGATPPPAATASGQPSQGATSAKLVQIAKVSLAILSAAAVYFAFGSADRDSSAPAASAPRATTAGAASPAPVPRAEPRAPSLRPPSAELNELAPARAARREDESPTREMTHRRRTSVEQRRPSMRDDGAIVAEASSSTAVAATREPDLRESSPEPNVQAAVAPATELAITAPQEVSTELAVLKRMQAALRAANFTKALALCADHERRWPHGMFELEREGVRVIAACGVSSDDAAPMARAFLARHPRAAIALRVSSACAVQLRGR